MHPVRLPVKSNTASPIGIAVNSILTIAFNVIPNPVYNMASGVSAVRNPAVKHCQFMLFAISICTNVNPPQDLLQSLLPLRATTQDHQESLMRQENKSNLATFLVNNFHSRLFN